MSVAYDSDADCSFQAALSRYRHRHHVLSGYLPELIAMKFGLRTATQLSLRDAEYGSHLPLIEEFCSRVGFFVREYPQRGEHKVLLLSRDIRSIDECDPEVMGQLFGYPPCCIDHFRRLLVRGQTDAFVNSGARLVENGGDFPFEMNPFLRATPFHLYKHYPCSLDCRETLQYGQKLLDLVREKNPPLHRDICRFTQAPALYTDIGGIAVLFVGRRHAGRIYYRSFFFHGEPADLIRNSLHNVAEDCRLFSEIAAVLGRGDEIALRGENLVVARRGMKTACLCIPPRLTCRTLGFRSLHDE